MLNVNYCFKHFVFPGLEFIFRILLLRLLIKALAVSQNSAIENYDIEQAERMQVLPNTSIAMDLSNTIPNDGTNACVFLALSICDTFLPTVKKVESVSWEELAKVAEKTNNQASRKNKSIRECYREI